MASAYKYRLTLLQLADSYGIDSVNADGNEVLIHLGTIINGKSAYEMAVEGGYTGTEQEFMAAIASITPKVWLTEDAFEALPTKDSNVEYNIYEEVDSL